MAKLDLTKIEGFKAEMTAEEKLKLLESYELPEPDYTGYIQKTSFDKTASELAEAKRQLKARMTEDEQKEAERQAAAQAMQSELEALRKEKVLSTYKASYLALGYDESLAADTAEAMADGKADIVFENQKKFIEQQKQTLIKQALEGTPRPPASGISSKVTSEQLNAMSDEEYYKIMNKKE